jgi:large subunit ribosomal protein L1
MTVNGKRYRAALGKVDRTRQYTPAEAVRVLRDFPPAKFDETVELSIRLGVDPRKADQMVRGTVSLPYGTGKTVRVAAFAAGDKAREAEEAGADVVGGEDLVNEVLKGNIEFDAAVATPDLMSLVGRAGRVLGPRGLMPNPKAGTVTADIGKAVRDIKAGKLEYRVDRQGNLHLIIGKRSFDEGRLLENYLAVIDEVIRAKPAAAKGRYLRTVTIASTMGPGIHIDPQRVRDVQADSVGAGHPA